MYLLFLFYYYMNYEEISNNNNIIIKNLSYLEQTINNINKKNLQLNSIYRKIENNKILICNPQQSYLNFQLKILKNEANYYRNIYNFIINKYYYELYELSENIIIILISLNKLEIDSKENKQNIFNKLITIKKEQIINYGKIIELVNITINNIKLVNEFLLIFSSYLESLIKSNTKDNIHNNSFELTIENKKCTITIQYNNICNKLNKIIKYFMDCSNSIYNQIKTSSYLLFFLKDNK